MTLRRVRFARTLANLSALGGFAGLLIALTAITLVLAWSVIADVSGSIYVWTALAAVAAAAVGWVGGGRTRNPPWFVAILAATPTAVVVFTTLVWTNILSLRWLWAMLAVTSVVILLTAGALMDKAVKGVASLCSLLLWPGAARSGSFEKLALRHRTGSGHGDLL